MAMIQFLTTEGCALCEHAWSMISALVLDEPVEIEVIDIAIDDDSDSLIAQYGNAIPLLRYREELLMWPVTQVELNLWFCSLS